MTFVFAPAVKTALKGRVALIGPSGSGKTWTALTIGSALAQGGNIAVIDTLRRQSLHYADIWKFNVAHLTRFDPRNLTAALGDASGHDVCIVDSWTPFWSGHDGMLEQVNKASEGRAGGTFGNGWNIMRPVEREMMEALMNFPGHLIVTIQTKNEYVVSTVDGKAKPQKVGLKPEQREGLEYEFDLVGTMDMENTLTVTKSHCPDLTRAVIDQPTEELGLTFLQWLNNGVRPKTPWEWRAEVLEQPHDIESLRALRAQIIAAGVGGAPMLDGEGDATTLIRIVDRLGRELTSAQSKGDGSK